MKKLIIRLVLALVVVVILAALGVGLFLDAAIKRGVESLGPKLTKADIKLQSVRLSLLSGSGSIKGLVVGNPEGFKTPSAINVGTASLSLQPGSLLLDKIIIKSVNIQGPEIWFETNLKNDNLSKILSNVQEATGGRQTEPSQSKPAKPAKKLQVDEFVVAGGKIHVNVTTPVAAGAATIPLPDIHLQDLGKDSDGITYQELAEQVLQAIKEAAQKAASGTVADIGKGALYVTGDVGSLGSNSVHKVTKGLGGLLKKN